MKFKSDGVFIRLFFVSFIIFGTFSPALAFTILSGSIEPTEIIVGDKVFISCLVTHSSGPSAIYRVAASVSIEKLNSAYPNLYDDGTHGDKVANDGIYSLKITAPDVSGQAQLVFIAVDSEMNEIESEPLSFTIQ